MKKKVIITILGILFLVIAGSGCGYGMNVEEMNSQYFKSTYGFDTGDTSWSGFGAGTDWSGFGAGTDWSGFGAGTDWSGFGAGTDWSHFGASVIPVQAINNIGMQETGIMLAGLFLAILLVTAGLILPKKQL